MEKYSFIDSSSTYSTVFPLFSYILQVDDFLQYSLFKSGTTQVI